MNNKSYLLAISILGMLFSQCNSPGSPLTKRNVDFNEGWSFLEDSTVTASDPGFDDSGWRRIDLPHDWSVEDLAVQDSLHVGPFDKKMQNGHDGGFLRGGTGWYRKSFTLEPGDGGKRVYLHFDGVQSEMTLWVNGQEAGRHVYGYTPFYFDITSLLKAPGQANQLAIEVVKPEQNSRWFTGAGIYRSVSLSIVHPVHVGIWGLSVVTPSINQEKAAIGLTAEVVNRLEDVANVVIQAEILGPDGSAAGLAEKEVRVPANTTAEVRFDLEVANPVLWDLQDPDLYAAVITVFRNRKPVDRYQQAFGIRTLEFSAERGFLLNGNPVLLKGGCMHHDNGLLGAAAFERAEYRKVELLKKNGFNAIRCAHNPPSEYFLKACDELGMLVIDETFDMWVKPKRPNDYHRHYADWWQEDTKAMVRRDRNHPSIIMWSVGNEVQERADSSGLAIARAAYELIKSIDTTRPVTQAVCAFWDNPGREWDDTAPVFAQMDVGGYNYQFGQYEADHEKYPTRIMFGAESMPMQADENWALVEKHPYVIGDFVWTGMDYLGEASIGHALFKEDKNDEWSFPRPWPWYQANCGDIDLIGNKKPQSYFRDIVWGRSKLEMAVHEPVPEGMQEMVFYWGWPREQQSWTWQGQEGKPMYVTAYSTYPEVRLELNGKVIGQKSTAPEPEKKKPFFIYGSMSGISSMNTSFDVPYEPGELKAIGMIEGRDMETRVLKTTGPPSALLLQPEQPVIKAEKGEIVYVNVIMNDADKQPVPFDSSFVRIVVSGPGMLMAAGNASPFADGSMQVNEMHLYHGRGLIVLRSTGQKGTIRLSVESDGIQSGTTEVIAE